MTARRLNSGLEGLVCGALSQDRRRIVHVMEAFAGGCFEFLRLLVERQVRSGEWDVHVVYSPRAETPADWRQLFPAQATFHELPMQREIHLWRDIGALRTLTRQLRQLRPAVIHLHSSKAGGIGRVAAFLAGITAVVYTPNGLAFLRQDVSRVRCWMYRALEAAFARFGGTVVAVSDSEAEGVRGMLPAERIHVIANAIDIAEIKPYVERRMLADAGGRPLMIGTAGRISPQKAPGLFADVARRVLKRWPDVRFVWIGGPVESGLLPLDVSEREQLQVTGWLHRRDALAAMAELDIYVQTSLWEGMPFAVIEAMALGLPVVATSAPGNRDVVLPEITGFLGETADELATHISQLIADPTLRHRMSANARRRAKETHSATVMAARFQQVYLQLLRQGSKADQGHPSQRTRAAS